MTPSGTHSSLLRVLFVIVALTASTISATAVSAAPVDLCHELRPTLIGTAGDDVLVGTSGDDVIDGRGGDDEIRGRGGDDVICGREGRDAISGGSNADMLIGGQGSDVIQGDEGRDVGRGGFGADHLHGGDGPDRLWGDEGDDLASGGLDIDECRAETMWSCNEDPENTAPVARSDTYGMDEDGNRVVAAPGVLGNDTDADGDAIGAIRATSPAHGALIFNDDGSFTYTPTAPNFHGTDSFTYVANDGNANSAPATVTLNVRSVNDPVTDIALSDSSVAENQPAGEAVGTLSATDADHTSHTFTLVAGTGDTDNAQFVIDGAVLKTTGPLDAETDSPLSIRVRADDSAGSTRDEVFVITVDGANDAPVITAPATESTDEDTQQVFSAANGNALSVADQDAGTNDLTVDLAVAHGTLTLPGVTGLVFTDGDGGDDATMTFSGTATEINAALEGLTYTPDANYGGADSLDLSVDDNGNSGGPAQSDAASVAITVVAVNDAPVNSVPTGQTIPEDGQQTFTQSSQTISVSDIDAAADDVEITLSVDDGLLTRAGTTGLTFTTGDGTDDAAMTFTGTLTAVNAALDGLTYTPDADFAGTDTLTITTDDQGNNGTGGALTDVDSITIEVSGDNDAPVVTASAGSMSYTEGDTATTVDGAVTVTDSDDTNLEGGQVRISSGFQSGDDLIFVGQNGITGVFNTGTGVLTLTGTASTADYQTALGSIQFATTSESPSSSKTVEFKVNDGDVDSNLATKTIAINAVNDGPTVTTSAGDASFGEGGSPVAIDPSLTITDPDSAEIAGALVAITGNFDSADDELLFTATATITGVYNDITGEMSLSGTDTVANYQAALRSVTYSNSDTASPSTATRTVSFQVDDTDGAASNTATKDVTIDSVDDAPVVTSSAGETTYTEGDPATTIDSALTVTDADDTNLEGGQVRISSGFQSGDDLVFVNQNGISGDYNSGTGVLTLSGSASVADYQTALRSTQFQSTNSQPVASKIVEFKVNDGDTDSNAATKDLALTATNDAPVVTSGGTLSYTENDPAMAVHSGLTVADEDNISGGSASITANYQAGQDVLSWTDNNLADNITLDSINSTQQTIVLSGLDTPANYQAALRAVTYQNGSENPSTVNRSVTFSATDLPGVTGSDTRTISVIAVDDPPAASNDATDVLEDAAATSITVLNNDTDIDGGPKTISSATDPANGTVVLTGGSPGAHTGLTYQPDPNYCNNPPNNTPDTFSYTLNGGSSASVSMTVTCVNDAPVADDETFNGNDSAIGNTTLQVDDPDDDKTAPTTPHTEITGDIIAGDTDSDGPGPLTVTPGTFATNDGGDVTIEADGDFRFNPAASTSCTDTSDFFDYTIEDSGSPEQTDTGRVTVAIAGCVWYVHNNSPGNSGTSVAPFDTLAQSETASGTNHTVFVYDGDNSPTGYDAGGYAMNVGERLIGEHEGLVVDPDQGGALTADTLYPANPGAYPTLTSTGAGLDVIDLNDGNEIRGFNLDPQSGHGGIQGSSGDTGGATIDDVNIVDTFGTNGTQAGLELNFTSGTFNLTNFTVNNNTTGVLLSNAGTVDFGGDTSVVTLASTGGPALSATGTNMGTSYFDDIVVTGSAAGGVILSSASGTTVLGDGSGSDLSLTTSSGATPALSIGSSGTISTIPGGIQNLSATGGPALDITTTAGATLALDSVSSTNSANDGINIDGLGTGTFSATSGTIGGAAGISFDLNSGSGAITYPGALNNGGGTTAIEVTSRSGGVVSLSGNISDTNDNGGGINVSANTGGSSVFSGATKQFNTGTSDAVTFFGSDGHTLVFSGGGSDIDTTSGNGVTATASGTLQFSGSGNTISSTALGAANRAFNVVDTDFAAADATFQSIASSGGVNGIRLNNTGTAGNLAITGTGANDSGGTIQSTSGSAIELQSTDNFTADEMVLNNPAYDGVGVPTNAAGNVTNFTFTDATITNAGQSDTDSLDSAFGFNSQAFANENNIDGVVTITGNTINTPFGSGVDIFNHNGVISDLFVCNNTITSGTIAGAAPGTGDADSVGDGIQVRTFGGTGFAAQLTDADITNNNITGFPDGTGIELLGGSQGTTVGVMGTPGNDADRIEITGNDIDGHSTANPMLSGFIVFDVEGRAQGHALIANNGTAGDPMTNVAGGAIAVGGAGDGGSAVELELHVNTNFLTVGNTPLSAGDSGIALGTDKATIADSSVLSDFDVQAEIRSNTVMQHDGSGIRVLHRDQFGHLDVDIRGNTIGASNVGGNSGIRVENGSSGNASFGSTMCARIGGSTAGDQNAITASGPDGFGDVRPGITLVERDTDPEYQFRISGLSPSPSNQEQAEAFVESLNPNSNLGTGFWAGERVAADNGSNWHTCTLPAF
jgi:hypothetical protein